MPGAVFALSQAGSYVVVGVVTALFLFLGGVQANRVRREVAKIDSTSVRTESLQSGQAALIKSLQDDRLFMSGQIGGHQSEIGALKVQSRETEGALIACRERETVLLVRITALEQAG